MGKYGTPNAAPPPRGTLESHNRRAFIGDGACFSLGSAFLEGNTVLPTFVSTLTSSPLLIGLVSTVRSMGYFLPQIFVASYIERLPYKKPFMMRVGMFMRLAGLGLALSSLLAFKNPALSLAMFYAFLVLFSLGDGLGGLPWMDLVAATIPPERRSGLFGTMQALGGIAAFTAGFFIQWILKMSSIYPLNYFIVLSLGVLFLFGSLLAMSFIRDPGSEVRAEVLGIGEYLRRLPLAVRTDSLYRKVLFIRTLHGSLYLALPFFALHAQTALDFPKSVVGLFVSAQMLASVIGGPLWGYIGDRRGAYLVVRLVTSLTALCGALALLARVTFRAGMESLTYIIYLALYFCLGCSFGGTWIGFSNYILDIAPAPTRATYVGLLNTVAAPLTLLTLVGGWILQIADFPLLFWLIITGGTLATLTAWSLPDSRRLRQQTD